MSFFFKLVRGERDGEGKEKREERAEQEEGKEGGRSEGGGEGRTLPVTLTRPGHCF